MRLKRQMAPGGEYESIRPFAAKLPEHAARLAAAIAGYRDLQIARTRPRRFLCGMRIAVYYATEAKRISRISWADPETALSKEATRLAPDRLGQTHRDRARYL